MMLKHRQTGWGLFALMILTVWISGCDNSGYGLPEAYVISGTVSTGDRVTGTVHVLTSKRADRYEAAIDPVDGTYAISIWKPDPPYLVWADLDGERTLYSYCSGNRNPSDAAIAQAIDDGNEDLIVMYQTTNITPLTDLIIGLAYLEDPQARFDADPAAGFPSSSKISNFQTYIEDIFADTFEHLATSEENSAYENFNLFHGEWLAGESIDRLLTVLEVRYTVTDDPESRTAKLVLEGGTPGNESIFYEYDLIENSIIGAAMDPDEALEIFRIRLGI